MGKHSKKLEKELTKLRVMQHSNIFVGFGKHDTPKNAEITRQSHMPGLLKYLNRADIHCTAIEHTGDIALVYRQMLTQRRVLA